MTFVWLSIALLTVIVAALRAHIRHMEEKHDMLKELYYQLLLYDIGKKKEDVNDTDKG